MIPTLNRRNISLRRETRPCIGRYDACGRSDCPRLTRLSQTNAVYNVYQCGGYNYVENAQSTNYTMAIHKGGCPVDAKLRLPIKFQLIEPPTIRKWVRDELPTSHAGGDASAGQEKAKVLNNPIEEEVRASAKVIASAIAIKPTVTVIALVYALSVVIVAKTESIISMIPTVPMVVIRREMSLLLLTALVSSSDTLSNLLLNKLILRDYLISYYESGELDDRAVIFIGELLQLILLVSCSSSSLLIKLNLIEQSLNNLSKEKT